MDRFPRISLMLSSDLLRGGEVLLLAYLVFVQQLELWQIFTLSALFGVVQAFFSPAYAALVPELVPGEMLPSANSLKSIGAQAAMFVGPALGATIIALGGTWLVFALDGVSFLLSALCLFALPKLPALRSSVEREEGVLYDIRKGISTVLRDPWLWLTLVVACISTIFLAGPDEAVLPLLVKQHFGAQVGAFALLTTLSALGALLAAIGLGHFQRLRHRGPLTYGAWIFACLMLLVAGLPLPIGWIGLAFFIQGAAITALGLAWVNTLQEFVPADLLGRVFSLDYLVSSGLAPIGYGLAGIAADHLGASPVFILGGAISASIIALGLLHPAVRAVD